MLFVIPPRTVAADLQAGSGGYRLDSALLRAYGEFDLEENHYHNRFFRHSWNCHRWMPVHLRRDVSREIHVCTAKNAGRHRPVRRLHRLDQALDGQ